MAEFISESVSFIGAGNIATYLAMECYRAGHQINMVWSRTPTNAKELAVKVNARWCKEINEINCDNCILIIALTDQATIDIAKNNDFGRSLVLHTAGSIPMDVFSGHSEDYGVLYPLQSISGKEMPVNSDVPLCIESNTESGLERLRRLAESISPLVYEISSENRLLLHLAAVFACNFPNYLYAIAGEIADKAGVPFEIYKPLIRETTENALSRGPLKAQTGPAVRNDRIIIKKHLDLLSFSPEYRNIYSSITRSIMDKHWLAGKKII
ncbi:MAG: Rossmann-like and DUF2520 domain-containing protein [Bacteroidales bacterium]